VLRGHFPKARPNFNTREGVFFGGVVAYLKRRKFA
jgi:hypothetical protein